MRSNETKTPQHKIERAVSRYLAGEASVVELAKEHGVSRPGFYLWIQKYKDQRVEEARRKGLSATTIDKHEKIDLSIENNALKAEVAKLKQKLFEIMLETDRL